jgi:FlaA1/EpsC-like NDP-sugar epimerase
MFGCGGHAKVIIDILEKKELYNIIGIIDSYVTTGTNVYGYKVLGDKTKLEQLETDGGIGAIGDNFIRSNMVQKIKDI